VVLEIVRIDISGRVVLSDHLSGHKEKRKNIMQKNVENKNN